MQRWLSIVLALLLVSGCASYGVVENQPNTPADASDAYSVRAFRGERQDDDLGLLVAFSGGGTRAAALSYGVMQELRDTRIGIGKHSERLLDEVDVISSVSGGSFTAAYFGLHGDQMFEDFEQVFLRRDVEGALLRGLLNPLGWFRSTGRTEMAVDYYEQAVFRGATFADLKRAGGPLILINASDLGYGVRFSFVQEYFNLLCSDLSAFPLARAVTASSAVPVLFHPVVVRNYPDCDNEIPDWLVAAEQKGAHDPQMALLADGLRTYFDRDKRKYAHFVDGGITDNLGLRAIYDVIELAGGPTEFLAKLKRQVRGQIVLITVNASTDPEPVMDAGSKQPSLEETVNAVTDIQLHRYNAATLALMEKSLRDWAKEVSTPERPVTSYFIELSFRDVEDPGTRSFFNRIPTSFKLSDEQVDRVIEAGRELLRNNAEFRRLLADLARRSGDH